MRARFSWVLTGVLLGGLCACTQGGGDEGPATAAAPEPAAAPAQAEPAAPVKPSEAPPAEGPSERTPAQALMRGHFEKAGEAREALVRADVPAAKEAMAWLAEHPLGAVLPESVQPLQQAMQQAAGEFAKATTLREAGEALATTLTKCGDCHSATDKGPTFAVPALPEGEDAVHHMQRHHWAAERMWEGLVKNDPEAFASAASAMAEGPINSALLAPPAESKDTVEKLTAHVHELGQQAKSAADPAARAAVYGKFLATCATCHRMLGRGPKPV